MGYKRIELPYKYDALEPYIDEKTMMCHYDGHHKAYQDNLNKSIAHLGIENEYPDLIDLMKNYQKIDDESAKVSIREFGGGLSNHNFLFRQLKKDGKLDENLLIYQEIIKKWETFEKFQEEFENQVKSLFGSGWVWFVKRKNNTLKIIKTFNQDNPWFLGFTPLMGIDLWEHAYYLKHQNKKLNYLKDFWNVIDWDFVNENYLDQLVEETE